MANLDREQFLIIYDSSTLRNNFFITSLVTDGGWKSENALLLSMLFFQRTTVAGTEGRSGKREVECERHVNRKMAGKKFSGGPV